MSGKIAQPAPVAVTGSIQQNQPNTTSGQQFIKIVSPQGAYFSSIGDDVEFVESCSCHEAFDPRCVYFPVGHSDGRLEIRKLDITKNSSDGNRFQTVMHVVLSDGRNKLTCFGSKITSTGIMWLCIFNLNMIVGCDLSGGKPRVKFEIPEVPCPNDLCISCRDENVIFVAGGTEINTDGSPLRLGWKPELNVPAYGQVYRINVPTLDPPAGQVIKDLPVIPVLKGKGLTALAGINASSGKVFLTLLYETVEVDESLLDGRNLNAVTRVAWKSQVGGVTYLADNISLWDEDKILVALYRSVSKFSAATMQSRTLQSFGWCLGKSLTDIICCCLGKAPDIEDPEVADEFSKLDKDFEVCCLTAYDAKKQKRWDFAIPVKNLPVQSAKEGGVDDKEAKKFDGHCTHVQRHSGKVVWINFKRKCVLVMDDVQLRSAML